MSLLEARPICFVSLSKFISLLCKALLSSLAFLFPFPNPLPDLVSIPPPFVPLSLDSTSSLGSVFPQVSRSSTNSAHFSFRFFFFRELCPVLQGSTCATIQLPHCLALIGSVNIESTVDHHSQSWSLWTTRQFPLN